MKEDIMTGGTIPIEFIEQIKESKRYKELREELKEFDLEVNEEYFNKYPNGRLTKHWKDNIIIYLNSWFKFHKERCIATEHSFTDKEGKLHKWTSEECEPLQKAAYVEAYVKYQGWTIKKACEEFNLQRTFYYELKDKAKRRADIEDQLNDYIGKLEADSDESTFHYAMMNMFKLIRICWHLHLMGFDSIKWANYEEPGTTEYKEIEQLLKEAKEYSHCEDYRDLQLLEYLLTKNKS